MRAIRAVLVILANLAVLVRAEARCQHRAVHRERGPASQRLRRWRPLTDCGSRGLRSLGTAHVSATTGQGSAGRETAGAAGGTPAAATTAATGRSAAAVAGRSAAAGTAAPAPAPAPAA
jgi:hypothetical protein